MGFLNPSGSVHVNAWRYATRLIILQDASSEELAKGRSRRARAKRRLGLRESESRMLTGGSLR